MTNSSNKTPHTTVAISQPGLVNYTIYVEKNHRYACDINIGVGDRKVEMKTVPFSKLLICMYLFYVYLQIHTMFKAVLCTLISPVYQWSARTPSIHLFEELQH